MVRGDSKTEAHVDLAFRLTGAKIPVDHGYALYAALCRLFPKERLHNAKDIGIHPIRGRYVGDEHLHLSPFSRLTLRLPTDRIKDYLGLVGKRIDIEGCLLRTGVCEVRALTPAAALRARFVTTRHGNDENRFREECLRQMRSLNANGKLAVGHRRTMRIHDKQIVGYSLVVTELADDESIRLQENGLGGRRKMGCGIFLPFGSRRGS